MIVKGSSSLLNPTLARAMTDLRNTFDDLNRQLTTGKKSETYGGLGDARSISLSMRARLSETDGYRDTISDVKVRVDLMSSTLERIINLGTEQRADTAPTENTLIGNGQTRAQLAAGTRFQEALSLLRTEVNGRHLFAGKTTEATPVEDAATILNGKGTQAGLREIIAERRLADRGVVDVDLAGDDSVGRVSISAPTGTAFTLTEDGDHSFGFKLAGGSTSIPGATISAPSGVAPQAITVDLPTQPAAGQVIRFSFKLPDGTSDEIVLTAATSSTRPDEFAIGATEADTVKNLRDVLVNQLDLRSKTTLAAASSVVAADSFFAAGPNTPPKRVPSPPETATTLIDGTPNDTVTWYSGDDDPSTSGRDSITARIDRSVTVSYGVRANEDGITRNMKALAIFAAQIYQPNDPNQAELHKALSNRVRSALTPGDGGDSPTTIQIELAGVQRSIDAISDRHETIRGVTQDLLDQTENVNTQEVATQILAVNTRLQASYQTTSMLSKLTLVSYL